MCERVGESSVEVGGLEDIDIGATIDVPKGTIQGEEGDFDEGASPGEGARVGEEERVEEEEVPPP